MKLKRFKKILRRSVKYNISYLWSKSTRKKVDGRIKDRKNKRIYGSGYLSRRKQVKTRLFKRDGNKCRWCYSQMSFEEASIDHIIPKRDGGSNKDTNLQLMHIECNTTRGIQTLKSV